MDCIHRLLTGLVKVLKVLQETLISGKKGALFSVGRTSQISGNGSALEGLLPVPSNDSDITRNWQCSKLTSLKTCAEDGY